MQGEERRQRAILMIMEPGSRVQKEYPLRPAKELADWALTQFSALFDEMYSAIGRPTPWRYSHVPLTHHLNACYDHESLHMEKRKGFVCVVFCRACRQLSL